MHERLSASEIALACTISKGGPPPPLPYHADSEARWWHALHPAVANADLPISHRSHLHP